MKLLNKDFKKLMVGYKAIKTVLKSDATNITLFSGTALVTTDDKSKTTQVLVDVDTTTDVPINLDDVTSTLLSKCKAKDDLTFTDNILIGNRELPYSSCDLENIPSIIDHNNFLQKFVCKASLFKEQLKGVSVATSKEESRPILLNVLLENSKLIAIDSYRIFTRDLIEQEHPPMFLQKHTVDILLKLLPNKSDDMLTVCMDHETNNVCISWGDYSVIDTLGQGEFMKWQQVMSTDCEYKLLVDREKLLEALDFAISTSIEKKVIVKFLLKENALVVGQDELKADYSKFEGASGVRFKELLIAFNPRYFVESLKDLKDDVVTLNFISALTPCIVEHTKGKDLILPIRLKD